MDCIQLSLFGKTYQEPFPATTEKISEPCWKSLPAWNSQTLLFLDLRGGADGAKPEQSQELDGALFGDRSMLNIGEFPNVESESLLSQILEANAPLKYYLSERACQGILTRASRRGKKLPDLLQTALLEMIEWWQRGGRNAAYTLKIRSGCAGGGKGALVQTEKTGTLQDQTLFKLIQEPTYCISGNTVDRATNQNGTGVRENGGFTVNTVDRHAVAYKVQVLNDQGGGKMDVSYDVVGTLRANAKGHDPIVLDALPFDTTQLTSPQNGSNPHWGDPCHPLAASAHTPSAVVKVFDARESGDGQIVPTITGDHESRITDYTAIAVDLYNGAVTGNTAAAITCRSTAPNSGPKVIESYGIGNGQAHSSVTKEKSGTLDTMHDAQAVAIEHAGCLTPWDVQSRRIFSEYGKWPALYSGEGGGHGYVFTLRWIVRRLTPMECERLQGYPDGWTDIGEWTDTKGKKHKAADSPRYKALGNSIALPQWFWIAQKMKSYMGDGAKLGSLFDGIGGFPLVWETTYGTGTARWASEIEEFPIAVTKKRFPERNEHEN
ncbi:hypothetical protein [Faecalibacterium tardum]|uniref:DNA (cytosine-5-)-methyltransferase n=1 Tax=Faecalibacterium tardum TaxID=3133156 RepID=A0ABV1AXX3_9FIRM